MSENPIRTEGQFDDILQGGLGEDYARLAALPMQEAVFGVEHMISVPEIPIATIPHITSPNDTRPHQDT